MKYTIYKLSSKFAPYRWWRNYDANNRNAPDIDIESYISAKGLSWTPLLNTKNEPQKYQTISVDSFDDIELYFDDINNVPDYIKIEFEKANGVKESAYYYVNFPSIYNATSKLATQVTYRLDKIVSCFYMFHSDFKTSNPYMFFVRKHTNRAKRDSTTSPWYIDFNIDTWLNINNDEYDLVVKNKQVIDSDYVINAIISRLNEIGATKEPVVEFKYDYWSSQTHKTIQWKTASTSWDRQIYVNTAGRDSSEHTISNNEFSFSDEFFNAKGMYEYVITKPQGYETGSTDKIIAGEKFWLFPITNKQAMIEDYLGWGYYNTIKELENLHTQVFTDDNIISRIITPISPLAFVFLNNKLSISISQDQVTGGYKLTISIPNGLSIAKWNNAQEGYYTYSGMIGVDGNDMNLPINNNYFITTTQQLLNNFNNGNYKKIKENNPHLLSPINFRLNYRASTNNESILTTDYLDLRNYNNLTLSYNAIPTPEWASRLLINNWNDNKALSQTANEITISELRQAPISCSAYNNTYLQRQVLDTGRNNTIAKGATSITASTLSLVLGIILSATGYGAPIGAMGILGGVAGLTGSAVNLGTGLAQNETQKKALLKQADTLNNVGNINGLSPFNTWAIHGLMLYTLGLSDMDATKVNNDDNMYGYYQNAWLPYTDYLNCWDGNYMLCDISKNYNSLFNKLKAIDSIFTLSDKYVNEFLNALNNGITWFDNGNYVDLATDENNWERIFPRS